MLNNKTILITGGTGSFGRAFVGYIYKHYPNVKRVVIFSRDEQKQFSMASDFSSKEYAIKYVLGDVRDKESLQKAMKGIDIVIHAAAMKHVPAAEQNPMECVKTNILGAQNVIDAALDNNVNQVVALSTDKSANPINVYGASKLMLEKLFLFADAQKMEQDIKFSVVRYGNIFGSKGSVVPFFLKKKPQGVLPITDSEMTRFSITLQESIDLVLFALEKGWGGEIVIPQAPSYHIVDIAKAVAPEATIEIIGLRKGEKIDEILLPSFESYDTVMRDNYYVVCPSEGIWNRKMYISQTDSVAVPDGFEFDSKTNKTFLSIEEIKTLIETNQIKKS